MEFRVGDLLIEDRLLDPYWPPRMGICMDPVPSREECFLVSVLVQGEVIVSWSRYWRVACREE
jgi:hypothetical protein